MYNLEEEYQFSFKRCLRTWLDLALKSTKNQLFGWV